MAFPTSPVTGQVTVQNGITYQYNSVAATWTRISSTSTLITVPSLLITGTTTATSVSTGALVVQNGMGVRDSVTVGATATSLGNITAPGIRRTTSATAPANPTVGDLWYWSGVDTLMRYTYDGTSSYWIDITGHTI